MATTEMPIRNKVADKGRVVIPAAIREALEIHDGDTIFWEMENGVAQLSTLRTRILQAQARVRHLVPAGTLVSEELSAERREAASHE